MAAVTQPPSHPRIRTGGRSERVRRAVLDAASELLAADPASITVSALADCAGVSEVTIYRRWGSVENVLVEAAVEHLNRHSPLVPTGDVRRDLVCWAQSVERSLASQPGLGLFSVIVTAASRGLDPSAGHAYARPRRDQLQAVLDAADPPVAFTIEDLQDRVLAPLYLRRLLGYQQPAMGPAELVDELLSRQPAAPRPARPRKRKASHGTKQQAGNVRPAL